MLQDRCACLTPGTVPGPHTDFRWDRSARVCSAPPPTQYCSMGARGHPFPVAHTRHRAPALRRMSAPRQGGPERHAKRAGVGASGGVRCGGLFRGLQAQITGTEEDPQQIVGQSLLSCLQNPVPYLSRLQRIHLFQRSKLCFSATRRPDCRTTGAAQRTMLGPRAYQYTVHIERGEYRRFSAWILT